MTERPPLQQLIWGTVATAGATSWIHVDDEGFGTSCVPLCGEKYWVVYRRNRNKPSDVLEGDMATVLGRPKGWMEHEFGEAYEAEALLLRKGMVL